MSSKKKEPINKSKKEEVQKEKSTKQKEEKNIDYKDMYLRALADYDNLKKDTEKQKQDWIQFANNNLINEILPVLNNFKIATSHIPEKEKNDGWVVGINHIQNQLKKVLENSGVSEIKTIGEKFNPELHEAVEQDLNSEELNKCEEGEIVKEIMPGYKLHNKVIVPAKVVVK